MGQEWDTESQNLLFYIKELVSSHDSWFELKTDKQKRIANQILYCLSPIRDKISKSQ